MDSPGTILIASHAGIEWSATTDMLSDDYGYRVLVVRSPAEAATALKDVHVDLIIAEDGAGIAGYDFLAGLRVSHPDIMRVLAVDEESTVTAKLMAAAAIYQFVRKPFDTEQIGLVVKRGLEARELGRRHRLLSRQFKVSSDSILFSDTQGVPFRPESQRFEKLVFVSKKWPVSATSLAKPPGPNCRF